MMDKKAILKTALEQFDEADTADRENIEAGLEDLEFASGIGQWDQADIDSRKADGRPTLTINRMPQFIRQVTGDIRRTNPAIKVIPGDNAATEEAAEIIGGLIRNIEQDCDGSSIYERAAESAAACGIGHWRIRADYESDEGFEQTLFLESIPNPFAVRWDPNAKDPTRKDARYCFVLDEVPLEDFKAEYPGSSVDSWDDGDAAESVRTWVTQDTVTVAEYYWVSEERVKLYQLWDGRVTDEKPEGPDILVAKQRDSRRKSIMWAKMTASEVIEGPVRIAGKHIPVIATVGEEMNVGKKVVRTSVIRYAKDAQRMYNYWRTAQTELVALQPKAPYLITTKQIAKHEKYWQKANVANLPFLPYNPDPDAGGAPKRQAPPMPSQGMTQEVMLAADDMKATTGIYDASLGHQGNETSGIAIRQRQVEGDISTSIYVDNLAKSIAHCGRVMVDMIPEVFDTTRAVRIIGKDDEAQMVGLNVPRMTQDGPVMENDLRVGRYAVVISTGPSHTTQRQEAAESMTEFVRAYPQSGPVIADLVAKNMDWPGADEIAERLKTLLPPGMADADDDSPEAVQKRAAAQQQMQQQQASEAQARNAELRKAIAEAKEAEADAAKAEFEAHLKRMELAAAGRQQVVAVNPARGPVSPVPQPLGRI